MKLRKGVRILLWSAGVLVAGVAAVYLLRWPLFGGMVRSKLAAVAAQQLQAEVDVGRLGGSMITGIEARKVTLRPRPGAPFRSATVERVAVDYGFLGSGEPSIRVEGARFVLSPKDGPPVPIHQSVRDVVSLLRSLRFSGSVSASKVDVFLPDGRTVNIDAGSLDHAAWTVSLRMDGFGTIDGSATLGLDGALAFDGRASEGPVRSVKIGLGPGADQCPLKISTEFEGHSLNWAGTAHFEKGQLLRVEGELLVKEGRAQTRVDFLTGRVTADADAVVAVDQEFKGDLALTGHGEGPLAGPLEEWTLREGRVKTRGARFRSIRIDQADVALGSGSLSKISFKGSALSGEDAVLAEGVFRWAGRKPDVEATVNVTAADAGPYLALLSKPPPLKCKQPRAEGRLVLRDGAVSYDGMVSTGAGDYGDFAWKSVEFKGSLRAEDQIEAREIVVAGTSFAELITASGKLEGEALSLRFVADKDAGEIGGRFEKETGNFEGRIRLEGPMSWLKRSFDIALPGEFTPVRLAGKVSREKADTRVMLDITGGAEASMALSATLRQEGGDWIVALAPGTLELPKRRVSYDAFVASVTPRKASLENLKLSCTSPELAARISGSAAWDEKETKVTFRMLDTTIERTPIDPLFARVTIDRASQEKVLDLRWGKDAGDHLRVTGRWGKELDLQAELRAGDLKRPLVRRFLPEVEFEGAVALDAHVTGTPKEPQATGTLNLEKLSAAGAPPVSLVLPLQAEKGMLRIWGVAERTAYGTLTVEGNIPLPGNDAPVDLSVRLQTDDLSPLLDRLSRQARAWIPPGRLAAEIALRGPPSKLELTGRAEFTAPRFKPPPPLAEALDLRVVARLDPDGVAIEATDGVLGQGPFWASGRWDAFRPGRPLSLWMTAWDALVVDDPLARLRVKPDVVLTWSENHPVKVAGRVEIPLAIYHREFSANTPGARTARTVSPPRLRLVPGESGGFIIPGIEGLEAVEIDLQFVTTGEFRIENSVVGVLLRAEGQLTGTAAEPALSGVIRSMERRGEVKLARGNFLRIESLEALLPEDIGRNPTIRFQGRVGSGEGAIVVDVEGPFDNPSLVLKSEPPLPQKDLLARLAFGQGQGAVTNETGVVTLAIYLIEQTQESWPSADRKETFFNRIRPVVVPGETSQQRRVPWELPPAGTLRSTSLRTEYVYNSFFSIVAETNREGDVGGDLKLRIRF
jgi:hypothetical protein